MSRRGKLGASASVWSGFTRIPLVHGDGPRLGAGVETQAVGPAPVARVSGRGVPLMVEVGGDLQASGRADDEAHAAPLALLFVDRDPAASLRVAHRRASPRPVE